MVQKRPKLKPRLGGHWRVGIQAVGYAFKISRVLIQDVGPRSPCVVCEVGWLPVVHTHLAAAGGDSVVGVKYQSSSSIKTIILSEAKLQT